MAVENAATTSPPPLTPENSGATIVQQEKLDQPMRDYIRMLAEQRPFTKDLRVDQRHVISALAGFWPQVPGWSAQAYETWARISDVVKSITLPTQEPMLVRISVAPFHPHPIVLHEPIDAAAVATFDASNGIERTYLLAPDTAVTEMKDMQLPPGLMVICQPAPPKDGWLLGSDVGADEFGESVYSSLRERDKRLRGDDPSPDQWKRNMASFPMYLAPHLVNEAGAVLGPLVGGTIWGNTVTPAALEHIVAKRHEAGYRRREAEEATRSEELAEAGAVAGEAERRTYPHERRTYPHERRGAGRMEYFGDDNSGTEGLLPVEREELARLGRITAAAEEELTGSEARELTAQDREYPGAPLRPEDFLATETPTEGQQEAESERLQNEEQIEGAEGVSPFAPPAEAVAAAAAAEQAIEQTGTLPETPAIVPEGLLSAGAPPPAGPEAPPIAAEGLISAGPPVEERTEVSATAAPESTPAGTEARAATAETSPTARGPGTSQAAVEPVRQVPPQQDERAWTTEREEPRERIESVEPASSGGLDKLNEHLKDELKKEPEKERKRSDEETRKENERNARENVERPTEQIRREPEGERAEPPAHTEREPQPEAHAEPRAAREEAARGYEHRDGQPQEHHEAQQHPRAEKSGPSTNEQPQHDAFERADSHPRSEDIVHPETQPQERGHNFYEHFLSPRPVETGMNWGRNLGSAVRNLSSTGLSGIAAALGISRQAHTPSNEERTVLHGQMEAEKRREAAEERKPVQDHKQTHAPGPTNAAGKPQTQTQQQTQHHRPSEEPPAPSPGE